MILKCTTYWLKASLIPIMTGVCLGRAFMLGDQQMFARMSILAIMLVLYFILEMVLEITKK